MLQDFYQMKKMKLGERRKNQRLSDGGKQRLPHKTACHTHTHIAITPTNPPQETDLNRNISCSWVW